MALKDLGLKRYLFSYHHDGADWSFEVQANDEEDAKARVAKMAWANMDGQLYAKVPAQMGWPARAAVWLLNRFSPSGTYSRKNWQGK